MKAYLVLDFKVNDMATFAKYIQEIPAFVEKHGGRYIVKGVEPELMEGDWKPERLAILEFPSKQAAKDFLSDSDAEELIAIRQQSTDSQLILAEEAHL